MDTTHGLGYMCPHAVIYPVIYCLGGVIGAVLIVWKLFTSLF